MSPQTEEDFRCRFNQFGNSYTDNLTGTDLMDILADQGNPVWITELEKPENFISEAQVHNLQAELNACYEDEEGVPPPPLAWSMFDGYKALMVDVFEHDDLTHVSWCLGMASACLIGGGGEEITMGIRQHEATHIFVDRGNKSSEQVLKILEERRVHWRNSVKIVDAS